MKILIILILLTAIFGCGTGGPGGNIDNAAGPTTVAGPVMGINSVQDGTLVSLYRIDNSGNIIQNLATGVVKGGRYTFNLTALGVTYGSDLILQISDPVSGKPVRAFVDSEIVNVYYASEAAVRMVLEMTGGGTGVALQNFTPNELAALRGALELLAILNQDYAISGMEPTISKIQEDFQSNPALVNFLNKASEIGDSDVGTGDIGNFFPNVSGNLWRFNGVITSSQSGTTPSVTTNYITTDAISGSININGINSDVYLNGNTSTSAYTQDYRFKNTKGMTYEGGTNSQTSFLAPFLPYQEVKFPLRAGDTFIQGAQSGILLWDFDEDGVPDKTDVVSQVSVDGFEDINVPAGMFLNAARITSTLTVSIQLSTDNSIVNYQATETDWFAPGIGRVKSTVFEQTVYGKSITTNTGEEDLIGLILNGQGQGVRRLVSLSASRVTPGVQVTVTAADSASPGYSTTWVSANTSIATIAADYNSNGIATAVGPGTGVFFALQNGQISDPAFLFVEDSKIVKLGANDIVYSPLTRLLYVSTPSDSNTLPGTITAIDPLTGQIGPSIQVGDMPSYYLYSGKLALSNDGRYLYVGLNHGANGGGIRLVDLVAWNVGAEFSVGSGSNCDPLYPGDFRVLPGNANAIAVSIVTNCSPSFYGLTIFDNGSPRANKIVGSGNPWALQFSDDPSVLYGFDSGNFFQISVGSNGVQLTDTITGLIVPIPNADFKIDLGMLYFQSDFVVDPQNWTVIGAYPGIPVRALVQPDSSVNRTFYLVGNGSYCFDALTCQILIFDQQNFNLIDSITIDLTESNTTVPSMVTKLIRWGTDGLAVVATGPQVILVRSPLIAGQ